VSGADGDVLVFELAGQRFGLPALIVREVVQAVAITPLPGAPPVVEGVINCRGRVLPVFDLRQRFHLPAKPLDPADHLIVADAGSRRVVVRVDQAVALETVALDELTETRALVPGCDHVAWIARQAEGLVLIHDLATFLTRAEADRLEAALTEGAS
jgi:purine-binding chemotaxis protein CheW